ncbi:hypothetical protein [Streptomyces sp. TE33382]
MSQYDFPQDLRDAQLALLQTRAECEEYARTLPWSAEPMDGWEAEKQVHSSYRPAKQDSPGYTDDQAARLAGYRHRLLELSTTVMTHEYWASLSGPDLVKARTALQHAHEPAAGEAA